MKQGLWLAIMIAVLLTAMALKGELVRLPAPAETPAADRFDANRSAARLARILGDERPHPVDSDANDAVRERLITEMRALGLSPRVTDDFACNGFERSRAISCARVRNVIATLGPAQGPHLLLSAHYDGTFAGPGAADAGIGVAALLEIAHHLRGQRLARSVTLLFNEGEEMGLIGARAFLERDPLAARVDTLINLEARGVEGPAIMFETSRPNGAAIALYRAASARPVANSLTADLYGLIPNSTDVTVFAERPWTILNFAIIGNETRYHSAGDDLAAFDRRSLRHMGDQALALTRTIAASAAPAEASGQRIYMDLLGLHLIEMPQIAGLALLGLLLFFFAVTSWRRRAIGRPLATLVAALGAGQMLAWAGQFALGLIRSGDYWRAWPVATTTAVYACALAGALLTLRFIARDADTRQLRAAFWFLFMVQGAVLAAVAPGGTVFFLLPPLVMATGMMLADRHRFAERIGAIAAILLLFITFGPALALFEELMSNGPHFLLAPLGAIILLPALVELKPLIARIRPVFAAAGASDLALIAWIAVAFVPAYSADRQQRFGIDYLWDADAREGRWAINNDGAPVPYDAPWERRKLPFSDARRWQAPAPALDVPAPRATLIGETRDGEARRLRLRIATNGAPIVSLITPPDSALIAAGMPGFLRPYGEGAADDRWVLRCVGRSCDGAELDLVVRGADPIEFFILGSRPGLPEEGAALAAARPVAARPQYSPDSTLSFARLRF
ncbi:MAG: M20/M25/M40 family metallo-hydrolase [Sphingomonas sp.]|nr:M20/M25/M40 family metallo-hydrolase [Sphingomonas sp.]